MVARGCLSTSTTPSVVRRVGSDPEWSHEVSFGPSHRYSTVTMSYPGLFSTLSFTTLPFPHQENLLLFPLPAPGTVRGGGGGGRSEEVGVGDWGGRTLVPGSTPVRKK